ncbi:Short-chain dehydrogenase/reductase SDR [Canna indica]|uniref:Short-chain dehydrogenase/reductase SDR n=1 Tax=Canna indica TaxID=4628 RepID=A0AAQ3QAU6_9LILI|nr:Short-chain dehydrogenase/reductase SDR [Canna indica]
MATNDDYKLVNKLHVFSLQLSRSLSLKVALVTGGDSGIGRVVYYCYVKEGLTMAFTYVKSQEDKDVRETLQMLKQNKTGDAKDPIAIPADLGYKENCKKVVKEVIKDIVENCKKSYEENCEWSSSSPVAARRCSRQGVRGAGGHEEEVGGGFTRRRRPSREKMRRMPSSREKMRRTPSSSEKMRRMSLSRENMRRK